MGDVRRWWPFAAVRLDAEVRWLPGVLAALEAWRETGVPLPEGVEVNDNGHSAYASALVNGASFPVYIDKPDRDCDRWRTAGAALADAVRDLEGGER